MCRSHHVDRVEMIWIGRSKMNLAVQKKNALSKQMNETVWLAVKHANRMAIMIIYTYNYLNRHLKIAFW